MKQRSHNSSIVLGTLLGDAWIQCARKKVNCYIFAFQQKSKEFAKWKAENIGLPYSIKYKNRYDKRTNKFYEIYHVHVTMDKLDKKYYHELFYKPKKEVSNEILCLLDDLSIATWYLDDGNMYYNSNSCHVNLGVNGFSEESKNLIITFFKNKYNINFKKTQKAIRITSKKDCQTFMNIVEKYIPECMKYKILSNSIKNFKIKKYGT